MTCKFTPLAPGTFVVSCSRSNVAKRSPCEVCKDLEHSHACSFDLRGAKSGQVCGRKLCSRCAVKVGHTAMCAAHARISARSIPA